MQVYKKTQRRFTEESRRVYGRLTLSLRWSLFDHTEQIRSEFPQGFPPLNSVYPFLKKETVVPVTDRVSEEHFMAPALRVLTDVAERPSLYGRRL